MFELRPSADNCVLIITCVYWFWPAHFNKYCAIWLSYYKKTFGQNKKKDYYLLYSNKVFMLFENVITWKKKAWEFICDSKNFIDFCISFLFERLHCVMNCDFEIIFYRLYMKYRCVFKN